MMAYLRHILWGRQRAHGSSMIPLDNLILFIHCPGGVREPDKRSIYRLMQNLCIQCTVGGGSVCVSNPYIRFWSPVMEQAVRMFRERYFPSYRLDTGDRHAWKRIRSKAAADQMGGTKDDPGMRMINDIVRVWWQCNGMPVVLQVLAPRPVHAGPQARTLTPTRAGQDNGKVHQADAQE